MIVLVLLKVECIAKSFIIPCGLGSRPHLPVLHPLPGIALSVIWEAVKIEHCVGNLGKEMRAVCRKLCSPGPMFIWTPFLVVVCRTHVHFDRSWRYAVFITQQQDCKSSTDIAIFMVQHPPPFPHLLKTVVIQKVKITAEKVNSDITHKSMREYYFSIMVWITFSYWILLYQML
jgi:hypothetical protein